MISVAITLSAVSALKRRGRMTFEYDTSGKARPDHPRSRANSREQLYHAKWGRPLDKADRTRVLWGEGEEKEVSQWAWSSG